MAKKSKQPANKSAFVRDFITANPTANRKAVEEAWTAAGHDGVISSALVSGLRTQLGLTGSRSNRPEAASTFALATKKFSKPKGAAGKGRGSKPGQPQAGANGTTAALGTHDEPATASEDRAVATVRGVPQGKTAFVREFILKNPMANRKAVEEAWLAAGNEGAISSALVSNLRSEMGLTGGRGSKGRGTGTKGLAKSSPRTAGADRSAEPVAQTPKPLDRRSNRGRILEEVERNIDRLIFKLMGVGGMEAIEDELRDVRRRLILSQGQ